MVKKAKKLGTKVAVFKPKKGAKYIVSDPGNADRVLDVLGRKVVFSSDPFEKFDVSAAEAVEISVKFPYLLIEEK